MDPWTFRTIIEPFRMKMVEPIPFLTVQERSAALARAHFNLFKVSASEVTIDLLTDSGTGAMSSRQWAALMIGDESYAGSRSFERLQSTVRQLTGLPHVLPVHQGRAAERILATVSLEAGQRVVNNTHFDTTRAHVEQAGATALDLPVPAAHNPQDDAPFKGNMDLERLRATLDDGGPPVALVMMTLTNNAAGGQPVSMANLEAVSDLCRSRGVPIWLDAARFAENAWFIHKREPGFAHISLPDIARRMFDAADGFTMSAKKDAIVNIGGLLCTRDAEQYAAFAREGILSEGFPTYGGLAGRDLDAMAVGLWEALDVDYLRYRERSIAYFGDGLAAAGISVVRPPGGHAVYIDAGALCPQLAPGDLPGIAVLNAFYLQGGVRGVEVGELMFPGTALQLVRLAMPRRVYTQAHVDYVVEVGERVATLAPDLAPYRIVAAPPVLRHFSAELAPA
jgi:tryptophanase